MYTTVNLMFFIEHQVEVGDTIQKIKEFSPKISIVDNKLSFKEGKKKAEVVNAKDWNKNKKFDLFETLDFFPQKILEKAISLNFVSSNKVEYKASIDGVHGYIMESIVSFPESSEFENLYNKEIARKAAIYFGES